LKGLTLKNRINWEYTNQIIGDAIYGGFSGLLLRQSHRQLASFGNSKARKEGRVLEIGAGRGEHFKFVNNGFQEYIMSDISNWGLKDIHSILQENINVRFEIQDVQRLSYLDSVFDRVIMSCVLSHVEDPYESLSEIRRVTKPGGIISFFVSADPSLLLRLIRRFLTTPKIKNLSIPYKLYNALSHRNACSNLIEISKYVFADDHVNVRYLPFRIRAWNLSTHVIVDVIKSDVI